jgi:hypothetical protein
LQAADGALDFDAETTFTVPMRNQMPAKHLWPELVSGRCSSVLCKANNQPSLRLQDPAPPPQLQLTSGGNLLAKLTPPSASATSRRPQVGQPAEAAKAALVQELPANSLVLLVPENSMMTMDFRTNRVRIIYSKATGLVVSPPRIG